MAEREKAGELSRSSPSHVQNEHRKPSADQPDAQARREALIELLGGHDRIEASLQRFFEELDRQHEAVLRTFTLGLLFLNWLSNYPAYSCGSAGLYNVPCPGCGNRDSRTFIVAPWQPGRDGLFECKACGLRDKRRVIGRFPNEAREWARSEAARAKYEWYRLPKDEQIARGKATREFRESDRRNRAEYAHRLIGGTL
jgi:hypothetical protein